MEQVFLYDHKVGLNDHWIMQEEKCSYGAIVLVYLGEINLDLLQSILMVECYVSSVLSDFIPLQRIEDIEMGQRELEVRCLIAGGERASLLEQVASLGRSNVKLRGTMMMERARVDRFRRRVRFMDSELRQIRRFHYYDKMRFRRLETFAVWRLGDNGHGGNGNSENVNGENGNPNENDRGARPVAQECTYQDFMKCQPLNFKGTKGVVGLIRWFEKIETMFHISNCPEKYQVKYVACTLLNSTLTWWNSHKRTIGTDAAFAMS
nr:putative reverse transcriptase domain-containing protein [Tanacetum cinerariifolium]